MAKEKIHCKNCGRLICYEAKTVAGSPDVTCQVCGRATPLEARAIARFVKTTPRKLRFIADGLRGKRVNDALIFLRFSPKRAAAPFSKLLLSARANAENTYHMNPENLIVSEVYVDVGPTMKRFMPRAMGRAAMVRKRTSHITIKVREPFHGRVPMKTQEVQPTKTQEELPKTKPGKSKKVQGESKKQQSAKKLAAKNKAG